MNVLKETFVLYLAFISIFCLNAFSVVVPDNYINCGGNVSAICTDGNIVAFEQSGWIQYTDLSQPLPQTTTVYPGKYPDIDGGVIVWENKIDNFYQIFAYDVSTATTIQITSGSFDHREPAISGSRVVYRYKDADALWHIAMTTISNGQILSTVAICTAAGNQYTPSIDGDIVAWEHRRAENDNERDIYCYDIAQDRQIAVCIDDGMQLRPKVSGDLIVWQDLRTGTSNSDIYAYSISQDAVYPICTTPAHQKPVSCAGGLMVWADMTVGEEGVYLFDFETYSIRKLTAYAALNIPVDISDSMVIWYDGAKISAVNLPLAPQLAITSPIPSQTLTGGREFKIVWSNQNLQRPVNLLYSADGGNIWQPVASSLTDTTSFQWAPPLQASSRSIIRICYTNEQDNLAGSGVFSVIHCDQALTADLSGDCYVGVEDLAILASQWMRSGT